MPRWLPTYLPAYLTPPLFFPCRCSLLPYLYLCAGRDRHAWGETMRSKPSLQSSFRPWEEQSSVPFTDFARGLIFKDTPEEEQGKGMERERRAAKRSGDVRELLDTGEMNADNMRIPAYMYQTALPDSVSLSRERQPKRERETLTS